MSFGRSRNKIHNSSSQYLAPYLPSSLALLEITGMAHAAGSLLQDFRFRDFRRNGARLLTREEAISKQRIQFSEKLAE